MRSFIILLTLSTIFSCNNAEVKNDKPVAQVFDKVLTQSEVVSFTPSGLSADDSLIMAQSYIRNWITKELLLHKAIENLSDEDKDIQRQVEDYRISLLIHKYKQKLISQKLESLITDSEVEKYYNDNKDNFILSTPVVKAIFFIVPKSAPNLTDVRKWFRSDKSSDIENIQEYAMTNAKKFDDFEGRWIELKYILNLIPGDVTTLENDIRYMKNIEKEDDDNYYFLKIREIAKEQTLAPKEYVKDEITLILKNKKKLQFENDIEDQINEEGKRKNYIKIY